MNPVKFMYAAYIATWVIQGGYVVSLWRRYGRLRREKKDLGK